jgi:peptidoglycan/LPS O-acetylase OafA/YrhL
VTSSQRSSGARDRVPALDSIRALAITFVMLRHSWPSVFGAGGFAGVELFFVLSGFLITKILLADEGAGLTSYARFYTNRVLRLYPALTLMVLVVAAVVLTVDPSHDQGHLGAGVAIGLTYVADLPRMGGLPEFGHLWTLAIEEQFYLLWPVLLITCLRRGAVERLGWVALMVTAATLVAGVLVEVIASHPATNVYMLPTTWAVTLVAGSLLAIGNVRLSVSPRVAGVALVALTAICLIPGTKTHAWGYLAVLPAVALLAIVLVANAASHQALPALLNPAARYLGQISYGVYLWDYPFSLWLHGFWSIPCSIAAAAASYHLVERRFLRLRRRASQDHAQHPEIFELDAGVAGQA